MSRSTSAVGFRTLEEECDEYTVSLDGSLPEWLDGTLLRNGPAKFEVGDQRLGHWFDGLAMLRKYEFRDGEVRYSNRYLRSESYADALSGKAVGQFATDSTGASKLRQWLARLGPPAPTDNANVHVARLDGSFVAQTEVPRWLEFDPDTLATRDHVTFADTATAHMITAHLVRDPLTGGHVGHALEFGRKHQYHIFRIPAGTRRREVIASIPTDKPAYVHSIGVSGDHVALVETPLRIDIKQAISPFTEGLFEMLTWEGDERDTTIHVVDRETGEEVATHITAPFFTFHTVNAFDDEEAVVLDLVAFADDSIVDAMRLDLLDQDGFPDPIPGQFVRVRLPHHGSPSRTDMFANGMELPTVPRALATRPYRYAYGQKTDRKGANGLLKVDTVDGTTSEWWEDGLYVEEPIMVQRPEGEREDDGVILATAVNVDREVSELLIFDASDASIEARGDLPHVTPFGFHGRFFPSKEIENADE